MANFKRYSTTVLPTRWGDFDTSVYRNEQGEEHVVISLRLIDQSAISQVENKSNPDHLSQSNINQHLKDEPILVRVHSACFTSEVLGSLKCDCREQLEYALQAIHKAGQGAVIYLFQEGRGIGLGAKIMAYALQEQGRDTVDANTELGYAEDARTYEMLTDIISDLNIKKVKLLTNNPEKVKGFVEYTQCEVERIPIEVGLNPINNSYLKVKKKRMGHMLNTMFKQEED
ncbi:MAG: GTP cyclohydrolase II [Deltaproteobacteria bacterium]|nr:GTP cyclohydrolase II [Deltaproteobacteria bacterium]